MYFKEKKIGCTFQRIVNLNLFKKTGSHIAIEWLNAEISPNGSNLKNKQTNLRKKISKHKAFHIYIYISYKCTKNC